MSRLFALQRDEDPSGVSGTGEVALGVAWPDGSVTLWWRGSGAIGHYRSVEQVGQIHGHNGQTRILWRGSDIVERLARAARRLNDAFEDRYIREEKGPRLPDVADFRECFRQEVEG